MASRCSVTREERQTTKGMERHPRNLRQRTSVASHGVGRRSDATYPSIQSWEVQAERVRDSLDRWLSIWCRDSVRSCRFKIAKRSFGNWSNIKTRLCLLGLKKKPGSAIRQTRVIKKSWRRATLPQGQPCNTIAASELNFCVRNGNRCGLAAKDTSKNY